MWFDGQGKIHTERFGKLGSMKMLNLAKTPEGVSGWLKNIARLGSVVLMERDAAAERERLPK